MNSQVQQAEALLAQGRMQEAVTLVRGAADAGVPQALAQLGYWHLVGSPLFRDLGQARDWLGRAAEAGDLDAALAEVALTANGTGRSPDWAAALSLLRAAAARHGGIAAEDLALVEAMDLDDGGNPHALPSVELLSVKPDVKVWRGFLSPDECRHIALCARDILEPSKVADPRTGRLIDHPIRTSAAAALGPTRETLPVQAILRRIAAATGTDVRQGESLNVLHYAPGQQYRDHVDTLPHAANQRIATVILYLNEGYAGGETRFSASGLNFAGRAGDALFFHNVTPDGSPDPLSRHAGLPVTQGAKWVATRWLRAAPFDVWKPD